MGGHVFKNSDVAPISKDETVAVFEYLHHVLNISMYELYPLGSTGKVEVSNDIDVAIDTTKYSMEGIHQCLTEQLGAQFCYLNTPFCIGSYAIPVNDRRVQLDIMFVDNIDWARFSYFSPGNQSKFKGRVRTVLLSGTVCMVNEQGTDLFTYDPNTELLIIRAGRTFDLNKGIRRIFQYRPIKHEKYLKHMKTVSLETLLTLYPEINITRENIVIESPTEAVKLLFGSKTTPKDVMTAEQVIDLIKQYYTKDIQQKIFTISKNRLHRIGEKLILPQELI